ncbi:MAG: sugar ABC transporter ATP-binding protein [Rectinemataceae bacterium]
MNEPILKIEKVTKSFPGVVALNGIDFDLFPGEVHVLIGENGAGKSTLIKLLSGVYPKNSGRFLIDGKEVALHSVHEAQSLGITTIYQEMNLIPNLTIAQNIFLGREPKDPKFLKLAVDRKAMEKKSGEILATVGLDISPTTPVSMLSIPQQQMVEIAKALSLNARIVIFDEPTATLEDKETQALFRIIRMLQGQGIGIIYISHRLEEIKQIGNRVTVLRDGQLIGTVGVNDTGIEELIRMMVGRELGEQFPRNYHEVGEVALELEGITQPGVLQDISLKVHRGEIVGMAGLVGSGRTETAQAIFGVQPPRTGRIKIFGKEEKISSPIKASEFGLAFVTEDRKELGLFQKLPVKENIIHAAMRNLFPKGIINLRKEQRVAQDYARKLQIKTHGLNRAVKFLSGGNQQKVVMAKWMATEPQIFILDEPTRGIDVGAKKEIYKLMDSLVAQGCSILMISSELPEILGMSDRIYVMHEGRIAAEYSRQDATQEKILQSAMGR